VIQASQIKPGDILHDNDPCQEGRTVRVTAVLHNGIAGISSKGTKTSIQLKFIHADDKPRRTGFRLETVEPF
jgi:hypothetical protein